MYADDFDGEIEIDGVDGLVDFLGKRPAFDANNFVLTFEEGGFPQLNIFVKNDVAVVYYMDIGENFVSKGTAEPGGTEKFYENKLGGEVNLSNDCVVSKEQMIEAAKQFFATKQRPDQLTWSEL
ncbi:CDI system double-stranded DNA deaminase immunity protein DddI [Burkholderia aenigmatica]|uniref:CDI system double-stranded DNA deaminase immunity protein DddI n=1 Tax=Burkholderia aenigmatica TaxID=2015348 RepID=UPI0015826906|nr:Imm1 family immunity protein [Burkholderia aenigmatica]